MVIAVNVYCLLTTFFAIACLTGWTLSAYGRRKDTQKHRTHVDVSKDTTREITRCFGTLRDIFDHFGNYVEMDPKLNDLLFAVSNILPQYTQELHEVVKTLRMHGTKGFESINRDRLLPSALHDGNRIDELVKEINDPVFNSLWETRTPTALCEMLRHGLFLSLGYGESVAAWSPDGVNLSLNLKDPGYQNWGMLPLWALKRKNLTWERWAGFSGEPTQQSTSAAAAPPVG